jgi:hypothetical protein
LNIKIIGIEVSVMRKVSGGEGLSKANQTVRVHLKVELTNLIPADVDDLSVS